MKMHACMDVALYNGVWCMFLRRRHCRIYNRNWCAFVTCLDNRIEVLVGADMRYATFVYNSPICDVAVSSLTLQLMFTINESLNQQKCNHTA